MEPRKVKLIVADGTAELVDSQGRTLWAADSDEKWNDEARDFIDVADAPEILDHLARRGVLAPGVRVLVISD